MSAFPIDIVGVVSRATVLLAVAATADLVSRRRASAAAHHLIWTMAMAALLAIPIAAAALPQWHVRIPVPAPARAAVAPAVRIVATPDAGCETNTVACGTSATTTASLPTRDALPLALAAIYLAGVSFLLARFAVEPIVLRRLTRTARASGDPSWQRLLDATALELRLRRPVRLLHARRDVMPLTFGTMAPVIVLPASAHEWTADRRRAVLLHELSHVARFDCAVQRLTAIVCAVYWPHPGVWLAARRLRLEREVACDDRVLAAGAAPRDYAGHLLDLAHSLGAAPAPATALGMARPRQLERRMLAILDAARNRAGLSRRSVAATTALATVAFAGTAIVRAALVPDDPAGAGGAGPTLASILEQDPAGSWELKRLPEPGMVQIVIRIDHGSHGRRVALSSLAGLPVDQIDAANATVHFPLRRDAGTLTIDGVCRKGLCAGMFAFAADPAFADALVKRGIGRPSPEDQLSLAIADAGLGYVDALASAGYGKPDVQTLVRAAQHGVDRAYLSGMTALGYRAPTLDALIQLRDHGVDPDYIRGMQAAGYTNLSADELRNARDHGADPDYARAMAALGFANLALPALINARDHGVDQQYAREMQSLGQRLTLDGFIRARDHGVDPGYIRGMAVLGYSGLAVDALIAARDHGVDPEYVRAMAGLGYKGTALEALIRMRDHGVDANYVRRLQDRGVTGLSVDDIIHRRDRGE